MKFNKELGNILVRYSIALVFLYFAFIQLSNPLGWTGVVPEYALVFGLSAYNLVIMNAFFEITFAILLILGLFTRVVSLILSIHLFGIALSFGVSPTGIRDLGLALATLSIFFSGPDKLCLDNKIKNKKLKK